MIGRLQATLITSHDRARRIEPFGCPAAESIGGQPCCIRWNDGRFRDRTCPHLESVTEWSDPTWRATLHDLATAADAAAHAYHRVGVLCCACKVAAPAGA